MNPTSFEKCYTNRTESKKDKNWLHYKYKNKNWNKNEAAYWVVHISLLRKKYSGGREEIEHRDDSGTAVMYGGDTDLMYDTDEQYARAAADDSTDDEATDDHPTDDHASDAKECHEDDGRVLPYAGRPFPLQPYCAAGSVSSLHSLFCLGVACLEFFFSPNALSSSASFIRNYGL